MLYRTKDLERCKIEARDGELGHVADLLFDDRDWRVNYAVVETGNWLLGNKVVVPRSLLGTPGWDVETLDVDLTREQVQACPGLVSRPPLSMEARSANYANLRWTTHSWGGFLAVPRLPEHDAEGAEAVENNHLRSAREIRGYSISATDGSLGHVEDFLVDDGDWQLRGLLVDTRNWLPGKKVAVPISAVGPIHWVGREAVVHRTKEEIRDAPELEELELPGDADVRLMAAHF